MPRPHRSRAAALAAATLAGGAVGVELAARRLARWGATDDEQDRRPPGDEWVAEPSSASTMAVDVAAPAEEVWSWLVQLGQGRGGWYSYDRLENLFRLRIHTTDEIHPEWQRLEVGDVIVMVPQGWPFLPGARGLARPLGLPVARVDRPHLLVLREDPSETPWDAVWTFEVRPTGPGRSRLSSHTRAHAAPGAGAALARALARPMDVVTRVMTRRMLLGIRDRAERSHREAAASGTPVAVDLRVR